MVRVTSDFVDQSFRVCASADRGELRAKSLRAWRTRRWIHPIDVRRLSCFSGSVSFPKHLECRYIGLSSLLPPQRQDFLEDRLLCPETDAGFSYGRANCLFPLKHGGVRNRLPRRHALDAILPQDTVDFLAKDVLSATPGRRLACGPGWKWSSCGSGKGARLYKGAIR